MAILPGSGDLFDTKVKSPSPSCSNFNLAYLEKSHRHFQFNLYIAEFIPWVLTKVNGLLQNIYEGFISVFHFFLGVRTVNIAHSVLEMDISDSSVDWVIGYSWTSSYNLCLPTNLVLTFSYVVNVRFVIFCLYQYCICAPLKSYFMIRFGKWCQAMFMKAVILTTEEYPHIFSMSDGVSYNDLVVWTLL